MSAYASSADGELEIKERRSNSSDGRLSPKPQWPNFYPITSEPESVISLSQADFQESHHSPASSANLFGLTVRSPPPDVQVVVPSRTVLSPPAPSPQLPIPVKIERLSSLEWEGLSPLPAQSPSPTSSPIPSPVPISVSPRFHLSRSSSRLPKKRLYVTLSDTDDS
ncbi:hypothetical protein NA56DRAFT_754242 [Hyaloscypha hepaticicola]|uniref:Uncharacterized protein n=1 Tax=Hyaloscypha hepaticicola TaxID=2082293 RepID=A0A2J6PLW2_9HELO|nr:hypothetical protein NA56DRAFT_754242 [Hyaloscypha hepaticicola]